jgi:hypothetical protein
MKEDSVPRELTTVMGKCRRAVDRFHDAKLHERGSGAVKACYKVTASFVSVTLSNSGEMRTDVLATILRNSIARGGEKKKETKVHLN